MNRNHKGRALVFAVALLGWAGSVLAHEDEHTAGNHLIAFLGHFHPVVVHFPVALTLTAALAEILFLALRRDIFRDTARVLVILAGLAALVAVPFGWMAESSQEFTGAYVGVVERHEALGISTLVMVAAAAVLSELGRRWSNPRLILGFRIALFMAAALVTATGFFGGELVHGIGHYSW